MKPETIEKIFIFLSLPIILLVVAVLLFGVVIPKAMNESNFKNDWCTERGYIYYDHGECIKYNERTETVEHRSVCDFINDRIGWCD